MFPNVPLQAITLDLADTHSVSLTVDHILNESIYIPGEGARIDDQVVGGDATPLSTETEDSTRHSTPTPRHSLTSPPSSLHYQHTSPPPPPPSHPTHTLSELDQRPEESHDLDQNEQSCDLHERHDDDKQQGSHDQASHDAGVDYELCVSEVKEPELRLRSVSSIPGPDQRIHIAKAIVPPGGESGSDAVREAEETEVSSTISDSYSQMFSSLQERKAELLRKAKR